MRVQEHIITPRYGGSVIGGIHDHISGISTNPCIRISA